MKRNRAILTAALALFLLGETCLGYGSDADANVAGFACLVLLLLAI